MTKYASPHINPETDYYLSLTVAERRKLPFAVPCINPEDVYRAQQKQQAQAQSPVPAVSTPKP